MRPFENTFYVLLWILLTISLGFGSRHRMSRPLRYRNTQNHESTLFSNRKEANGKGPTLRKDDFGSDSLSLMNILQSVLGNGQSKPKASRVPSKQSVNSLPSIASTLAEWSSILMPVNLPGGVRKGSSESETSTVYQNNALEGLQSLANLFLPSSTNNALPSSKKTVTQSHRNDPNPFRYEKVPFHQSSNKPSSPNPFELIAPLLINEIAPKFGLNGNLTLEDINNLVTGAPKISQVNHGEAHPTFGNVSPLFQDPLTGINIGLGQNSKLQDGIFAQNPLLLSFGTNASLAPLAPILGGVINQGLGSFLQNSEENFTIPGAHSNIGNALHDFLGQNLNRSVSSLFFPNGIPNPDNHQITTAKPEPTKPPGYTCKKRVMMVEEVTFEESVKCEDVIEEECFPSYRTIYQPMKVEECETIFKKVCYIAFKNVAREKSVQICQEKKSRDCNFKGHTTCSMEEETVCETFTDPTMRTSCRMEMEEVCDYDYQGTPINCARIPKRKCRGRQAKAFEIGPPETECYNFPRKICGPEVCPIVTIPNVCEMKNETVIQEVPDEECKMEPQKECRIVTKIVPKLDTKEDCVQVSKEICNNVRNPVTIKKPVVRTWCGIIPQEKPIEKLRTKLLVALGCDEYDDHITDVEIIDLSGPNSPYSNLSNQTVTDPSDLPEPSHATPMGGFVGGKPWVCGGFYRKGFCVFLNSYTNVWETSTLKLENLRTTAASFTDKVNDELWITGGQSVTSKKILNSTEILVKGHKIIRGPDLPFELMAHCAVNVNSTHFMVIGGMDQTYQSNNRVHLVNKETGLCQEMDPIILARSYHACGKIQSSRGSEIVVIGGISFDGLSVHMPIEMLSLKTMTWRTEGITEQNIQMSTSVAFNSTLLIVGGPTSDSILELNPETLELIPRKEVLVQKKNSVVAMLIPDTFAYGIKPAKIEVPTNLLTVAGFDETTTDIVEVIPLEINVNSNHLIGRSISNFPTQTAGMVGAVLKGVPWVCGGTKSPFSSFCFKLDPKQNQWIKATQLTTSRSFASGTLIDHETFWISGGGHIAEKSLLDSIEIISRSGKKSFPGPLLPKPMKGHCLVAVNSTYLVLIGGSNEENQLSKEVFAFNMNSSVWTELEPITFGRRLHGCGLIDTPHFGKLIVVIGGEGDSFEGSLPMEIFHVQDRKWIMSPGIEARMFGASIVPFQDTLLAVGSLKSNSIFELNKESLTWYERNEKLRHPRGSMVTMLIPNSLLEALPVTNTSPQEQPYFFLAVPEGVAVFSPTDLRQSICLLPRPNIDEIRPIASFVLEETLWSCYANTFEQFECKIFDFDIGNWMPAMQSPQPQLFGSLREIVSFNATTALLLRSMDPSGLEGTFISSNGVSRGPKLPIDKENLQFVRINESHSFVAFDEFNISYTQPKLISNQGDTFPGAEIQSSPFFDCDTFKEASSHQEFVICISTPQSTQMKVWQFSATDLLATELASIGVQRNNVRDAKFVKVGLEQLFLMVQDDAYGMFYQFDSTLKIFNLIEETPTTSSFPLDIVGLMRKDSPCFDEATIETTTLEIETTTLEIETSTIEDKELHLLVISQNGLLVLDSVALELQCSPLPIPCLQELEEFTINRSSLKLGNSPLVAFEAGGFSFLQQLSSNFDNCTTIAKLDRTEFAALQLDSERIWITGGLQLDNVLLNTSLIVDRGLLVEGPQMARERILHCMVQINSSHTIVAGGYTNDESHLTRLDIYDWVGGRWIIGPELQAPRLDGPSCGLVQTQFDSVFIMAGGDDIGTLSVLSLSDWTWSSGPNLPEPIFLASTVNTKSHLLISGGYKEHASSYAYRIGSNLEWETVTFPTENPPFTTIATVLIQDDLIYENVSHASVHPVRSSLFMRITNNF